SQTIRERNIEIKLTPIKSIVANREVILIDDSIVRGSTIKRTVNTLKEAGASKIHVRIAAPPVVKGESMTVDIPYKHGSIQSVDPGDQMRMTRTVKAHTQKQGVDQTEISRAKLKKPSQDGDGD